METTNKAWSTLTIKGIDEEQRIITGLASTPSADSDGDIVEPRGAKFTLPLPLLSQHDRHSPIGQVVAARLTDKGIEIEARIAKDSGLDYVEKAWRQIKAGLVRGLSIGFRPIKYEPIKGSGMRFLEWAWHELSAVTIPANAEASIVAIKHYSAPASEPGAASPGESPGKTILHPGRVAVDAALSALARTKR